MSETPEVGSLTLAFLGGTGDQGRGLARRFAIAGNPVILGSRQAERAQQAAGEVGATVPDPLLVTGATNEEAAAAADVVVVAVPWEGHETLVRALAPALTGKTVIDCVNPMGFDKQGAFSLDVPEGSAAQQAESLLPDSTVVAAFHHVSAVLLLDPDVASIETDVLVLGDIREATDLVQALVDRIAGMRGVYGGRLRNAGQVEALTANLVSINRRYKAHAGLRVTDVYEDDLAREVTVPNEVTRVVSIVPSLTEAIAASAPGLLVGATDWCTHPRVLDVARIGGTKNPRVEDIRALAPDVVIANEEENRATDLEALVAAGVAVWVTAPTSLPQALVSLDRMLRLGCGLARPGWLDAAEAAWADPIEQPRMTAFVPIWRRPWMALGRETFAGDLLARLGIDNALARAEERYPKVDLGTVFRDGRIDLVLLPDEPYAFCWDDGPEVFAEWRVPVSCVSGRHLTWYGPSLVEARGLLLDQIADARLAQ